MKRYASIAALLSVSVLASCGPDALQNITAPRPPLTASRVRFFNFGVNAPGVNFYSDTVKMTAINSGTGVEATTGIVYGGVGAGGDYQEITSGSHVLTGKIAAATDKDLAISPITATIGDGKFYSSYMRGF